MEYAAMLSSPDLVSGLRDLLADSDMAVVKRTVRVFANVYRHALQLLATGDLDEATFSAAWPAVRSVAEQIIDMLSTAENEGVIVHVVRFLEAALVAHLLSDVSRYPEVAAHSPKMVAKGVDALTGLISTPYIGGSAFLVAVRALITVACYKHDLWTSVTSLIEKKIASPPPTLFDHNVRSLHKILQRNLFRLLRRADSAALRSQLIEMMVTVGVPRRMLSQWAPPQEARKRPAQAQSEESITGRSTPPTKRPKQDSEEESNTAAPRDPRETRAPRDPRDPRSNGLPRDPRDPRNATRGDPRQSPPQDPRVSSLGHDPPANPGTPPGSGRSTPEDKQSAPRTKKRKDMNANFEFLKSLITSKKKASSSFLESCSEKERALYERLDHPHVVKLVLSCLDSVPDSPPEDLLRKLGRSPGDVEGIREQLTSLLAPHLHVDFISSLTDEDGSAPPSRPSSNSSSAFSARATPPHSEPSPPSPPSSARSTPSDPAQVCHSDVDLRHLLNRGFLTTGDVDMRDTKSLGRDPPVDPRMSRTGSRTDPRADPRAEPRAEPRVEPRLDPRADPRAARSRPDPRTPVINTSTRLDPRIAMPDPWSKQPESSEAPGGSTLDPRITQAFTEGSQEPLMMAGRSPFMTNAQPGFMANQPPQNFVNNSQQNFMNGPRPNFMESGPANFMDGGNGLLGMGNNFDMPNFDSRFPGGGVNRPMMAGPPLSGPGPMCGGSPMGGPHEARFMGPRGMGGPWQGNMNSQNRLGVMMPLMNGNHAMFSPAMHL